MSNRWSRMVWGFTVVLGLAGRAEAGDRPSIAVVAYNQAGVAADTLARAKTETARIYGEAGVDVIWMDHAAVEAARNFAIRLLIRRAVSARESVLGSVAGDTHETGGLASVFYDRVLRSAHERRQDVAGVLAYAMAHEMGHLLLPFPAHAASGIMRSAWDGDDLRHIANGSLRFSASQTAAIRAKASRCCQANP
jgi:hypothetical protein